VTTEWFTQGTRPWPETMLGDRRRSQQLHRLSSSPYDRAPETGGKRSARARRPTPAYDPQQPAMTFAADGRSTLELDVRKGGRDGRGLRQRSCAGGHQRPGQGAS
jgi:hypothetical protein